MLKGLEDTVFFLTFAKDLRVVPHRSGYSTLTKNHRDRFPCQWRATVIPHGESSNAGGLQQQGAPTSCETGVFTKSSARTRFFITIKLCFLE